MERTTDEDVNGGLRSGEGVRLKLPSGRVITARRPGLMQLAVWEMLPFDVAAEGAVAPASDAGKVALETIAKTRDLLVYACISPRISVAPKGDGEISPLELSNADLTFIVRWARRLQDHPVATASGAGSEANGGDGGDR